MCGRYTLATEARDLLEVFDVPDIPFEYRPRYNIAPTQEVPAIAGHGERKRMGLLRWGLVPSWADDPGMGARLINARSETVHRKPSFREGFRHRRCLLPADGFYEWKKEGPGKTAYWIHRPDRRAFAMAGIWERWEPAVGDPLHTCSILTRDAVGEIRELHDRMPVILDGEDADRWLDPAAGEEDLLELLERPAGAALAFHPVSAVVNSARNDVPECIERLADS